MTYHYEYLRRPHDGKGLCDLGSYDFIGFNHFKYFS